jgi:tetratricopeptide (TPR) repeat protein
MRRAALPPSHPDIAMSLCNMATLHDCEGRCEQALPLYEEALRLFREMPPPGHPNMATCLENLATFHEDRGDYDLALPLYQEALKIRRAEQPRD